MKKTLLTFAFLLPIMIHSCRNQRISFLFPDSSNSPLLLRGRSTSTELGAPPASSYSLNDAPTEAELEAAESRAAGAEKKVAHLAALLSESEAESARMGQLAEVLKEEIRSYQRAEERHKHIENLEYVKNIILKVGGSVCHVKTLMSVLWSSKFS